MKSFIEFITENSVPERQQFKDTLKNSSLSPEAQADALKQWDARPENWGKNVDLDELDKRAKRHAEIQRNIDSGPHIRAAPPSRSVPFHEYMTNTLQQHARELYRTDPTASQIGLGYMGNENMGTAGVGAVTAGPVLAAAAAAGPALVGPGARRLATQALASEVINKGVEHLLPYESDDSTLTTIGKSAAHGLAWAPWGWAGGVRNMVKDAAVGSGINAAATAAGKGAETLVRTYNNEQPDNGFLEVDGKYIPVVSSEQRKTEQQARAGVEGGAHMGTFGHFLTRGSPNPVVKALGPILGGWYGANSGIKSVPNK